MPRPPPSMSGWSASGSRCRCYGWPVRAARHAPDDPPRLVLLRLSAQRYNEPADFDRLAGGGGRRDPVDRPGPPVADEQAAVRLRDQESDRVR